MNKQQGKAPQIRFPEFKRLWEQFYLGNLLLKTDKKNKCNLNLPVYSINNTCGFVPQDEQFEGRNSKERGFDISIYKVVNDKTFAYNPARINVGSIGYSYDLDNILVSSLYVCFKTKENLDDIFFIHYLNTNTFRVSVLRIQEGGVRQYLFFENLSKIKIFAPSIPEQIRIASFFTVLDNKIAQLKQKKNLLAQYKKGIMQKLFSQELRFKDENGKEFPEWEKKKLGEIFKIKTEKFNPLKESYSVKCVELEHLATGTGKLLGYVEGSNLNSIKHKFKNGDVLFGKLRPYLRKFLKPNFDGVCSSEIWVLKGLLVSNHFLFWLIQTDSFVEIANKSSGSKMPRADWSLISMQYFHYPEEKEQSKIANFLSAIDDKINRTENQIQQTQEWKKGLLQNMFV